MRRTGNSGIPRGRGPTPPVWIVFTCILAALVSTAAADGEDRGERCAPRALWVESDRSLLVLCGQAGAIIRVDSDTGEIVDRAPVGAGPFALCAHPDGLRLYVTCRRGQEVVELTRDTLEVLRRFSLRGDPTGVAASPDGRRLFVGVHAMDQVAVFDLATGTEESRLVAGNGPEVLQVAPDSKRIYVTNLLPDPAPPDEPCRTEITVIDASAARVVDRIPLRNANIGRGIAFTADGKLGIAAVTRPKNLVPMVQVARGWVVTNAFAVFRTGSGETPVQLLIDLPNRAFADPYGVAFLPDDSKFYVTAAGGDAVVAVETAKLRVVLEDIASGAITNAPEHLGLSRRYVTARVPVGANPEAVAVSSDGNWVYVANRLDDTMSIIDSAQDRIVDTFVIGARQEDTLLPGERLFHSAARTFHHQFSCASCHPDRGFDGLTYDLEPDGLGRNLVDNRNLRAVAGTGPFKWVGTNPDIATQCGTRTAKWIVRTGWLTSRQVVELADYIWSIEPVENPYTAPDGLLTPAQARGKIVFERTLDNRGDPIPDLGRCNFCHRGPRFTDGNQFDVGTGAASDSRTAFDTAHLTNIFESAPYLHDGRAATLEEIWTRFNADDSHGLSSDWTKQQLNDLVEYLKSL